MNLIILLSAFILFVLLTPGVLLFIPSKKCILTASIVHGIIFTVLLAIVINLIPNKNYESFYNSNDYKCMCPLPLPNKKYGKLKIDTSNYYNKGIIKVGEKKYNSFSPSDPEKGCTYKETLKHCGGKKCRCPKGSLHRRYRNYYKQCTYDFGGLNNIHNCNANDDN